MFWFILWTLVVYAFGWLTCESHYGEARDIVRTLSHELESEVRNTYYHEGELAHPSYQRKYERDMEPVNRARRWLHDE